jgi:hypothetical protein
MRPATTAALIALLVLLIGAAVLQLVFKVGGGQPGSGGAATVPLVSTTTNLGSAG